MKESKTYALDMRIAGAVTNHNGHTERFDYWKPTGTTNATRAAKAIKQAERLYPGRQIRVRLMQPVAFNVPVRAAS